MPGLSSIGGAAVAVRGKKRTSKKRENEAILGFEATLRAAGDMPRTHGDIAATKHVGLVVDDSLDRHSLSRRTDPRPKRTAWLVGGRCV